MGGFLQKIKTWWQSADRTQKLIAICGGGGLVVLLVVTFIVASRPKMALVFTNLDPEDAGTVSQAIETMGIACDFDTSGNVKVPSDLVAKVRATLAMQGKLPKSSSHSVQDLQGLSPFGSKDIVDAQLKTIMEGELSQAIQFFDGVGSANVQITLGTDSPFVTEQKPAMANVTVSEKGGGLISQEEARAMANLVASSVPGLDKGKVTIFTRSGRALWDGSDMQDPGTKANSKLETEKNEARKRRDQLQDALNRMLGPGNAIAMVDLTLDLNEHDKTTDFVDPSKSPIENQSVIEAATGPGGSGSLISGAAANQGSPSPPVGGNGSGGLTYNVQQKKPVYGQHTTTEHVRFVGGDLKTMSVTVLVNQPKDKTVVNPKDPEDPIVKMANGILPPHQKDDPTFASNFAANIVAYPFDTSQADAAKKAEDAASSGNRMQQILSLLPIAALLIVAFLVMKSIGKLANRPLAMLASASGPSLPMSSQGGNMFTQALNAPNRAMDDANRFVLPEIVKQKALEAGISEEQLQAAIEEAGEAGISVEDIPSIKSKVNVPLEQIKRMAHERPETVAMLIKSWLIEEGIRR
ncbi:MAG: flagellar basal-body MS-ring/collar protein FliF [Fimbriimonadales bacterium]